MMTYRGEVKNGQIVLEAGATLRDGTKVEVIAIEKPQARRPAAGTPEAILASPARWVGTDEEAVRLLDDLRREKWAELEADVARDDPVP
jgi:hypothetical protein